jgi:cellulose synthase/poly-beta-1,6-N-acetylglucosamine synthase-like glycosyltransferase
MRISYAIPVCNEHTELETLLAFLLKHINKNDEIVVQCDQGNTTPEVYKVLDSFKFSPVGFEDPLKIIEFPLKGHFSNFKNNLKNHCTGDWIFQIDADELPHESLITNLKALLEVNTTTEMLLVPRINTVKGLTQEHINKWRWNINEKGWVNWPDYQTRIIQNSQKIKWQNKVHEQIVGISTKGALPMEEEWCLYHPKTIEKQEVQNKLYDTL